MEKNTFIAIPSHNGDVRGELIGAVVEASQGRRVCVGFHKYSKLTQNFNMLLCEAINRGEHTHFAMLHADIFPAQGWLTRMHDIMERTGADILSVVMPLKNDKGLTSIGLCEEETVPLKVKRLTMNEIYQREETFTDPHIIVNTGLMLINLKAPFMSHVGRGLQFRVTDQILKLDDGRLHAYGGSEDWLFSLDARGLGAKIFVTREVSAAHIGGASWPNDHAWGTTLSEEFRLS